MSDKKRLTGGLGDGLRKHYYQVEEEPRERNERETEYSKRVFAKKTVATVHDRARLERMFLKSFETLNGVEFVRNQHSQKLLNLFLDYFSRSESFLTNDMIKNNASFDKGLFLTGSYGVGKTSMLKAFKRLNLPVYDFGINSCNKIVTLYDEEVSSKQSEKNCISRFVNYGNFCYDDLGTEKTGAFKVDVMKEIIEERYYRFTSENRVITHVSTNLNEAGIRTRYGDRIGSRLYEMFNLVVVGGEDFRRSM